MAKKNSYIKMLDDAFKQALDINHETSFVEAATGRYNDQNETKIETQINELSNSGIRYKCNEHQIDKQVRRRIMEWIICQIIKQK